MQTFIPEIVYADCAAVLDRQRLGKQRVECLQIMNILCGVQPAHRKGWRNHPAVVMWQGWEYALLHYTEAICDEWTDRGYIDNCMERVRSAFYHKHCREPFVIAGYPGWWDDMEIHVSHQSNLMRKNPDHYSPFYGHVPDDLPYVWGYPRKLQGQGV